jgi:hypothetical protein
MALCAPYTQNFYFHFILLIKIYASHEFADVPGISLLYKSRERLLILQTDVLSLSSKPDRSGGDQAVLLLLVQQ